MDAQQGSLELLETEIAQKLLNSSIPARLAYVALDGSPVAIPIWFHWNGSEIVFASPVDALKVPAMKARPRAAVTIDTDTMPYEALMIRETVAFERINGVVEEYALTARRCLGDEPPLPGLNSSPASIHRLNAFR